MVGSDLGAAWRATGPQAFLIEQHLVLQSSHKQQSLWVHIWYIASTNASFKQILDSLQAECFTWNLCIHFTLQESMSLYKALWEVWEYNFLTSHLPLCVEFMHQKLRVQNLQGVNMPWGVLVLLGSPQFSTINEAAVVGGTSPGKLDTCQLVHTNDTAPELWLSFCLNPKHASCTIKYFVSTNCCVYNLTALSKWGEKLISRTVCSCVLMPLCLFSRLSFQSEHQLMCRCCQFLK